MGGAHAQPPGARGHLRAGVHVRGRAEDRWPGDQPCVSRRRARARRDARQRRDRGGRDAQPAHDRRDPAAHRGRAGAGGGARRGVHVAEGLHGAERAPCGSGRVDVHEPAQLGRGHDPPARPGGRGQAPTVDLGYQVGVTRGPVVHGALAGAGVAARARLPRQRRHQAARRRGRGGRAVPRVGAPSRRARLRDRRRRREGRRPRAAAPARLGRARPALGGRVEVPADDGRDDAREGDVERRQVRRPAPLCGAERRRSGRRDDQDGDAAQRGGHRAQGPARGRGGDRACAPAT